MAELDSIVVYNPTDKDFSCRFNGELYTVPAHGQKEWAQFLALHVAKHFSDALLNVQVEEIKKTPSESPFRPEITQLIIHDNPKRRIALYTVLRNKENVERVITAFPFKGFIGEMNEYDAFVDSYNRPVEEPEAATVETDEAPKVGRPRKTTTE